MKAPVAGADCGGGVHLRPLRREDLPMTLAWRNRDDVRIRFKSSAPIEAAQHAGWFEAYIDKPGDHVFIVEHEGRPVGQAAIYAIDAGAREAEVGRFVVAPGEGGKGYMRAAIAGLVALASREWGLRRVYLEVFADNERAVRLYGSLGFTVDRFEDGMLHMSLPIDG